MPNSFDIPIHTETHTITTRQSTAKPVYQEKPPPYSCSLMKATYLYSMILLAGSFFCLYGQNSEKVEYDGPNGFKAIVRDYEIEQKEKRPWPDKYLLPVAIAYATEKKYAQATELYVRFLKCEPKNTRAIRGLGNCLVKLGQDQKGIEQYALAWSLGDDKSLKALAFMYAKTNQFEKIGELVQPLLARRSTDLEIVNSLLAYSIWQHPPDKDLFYKSIDGRTDDELTSREDTVRLVILGLEKFKDEKRLQGIQLMLKSKTKT